MPSGRELIRALADEFYTPRCDPLVATFTHWFRQNSVEVESVVLETETARESPEPLQLQCRQSAFMDPEVLDGEEVRCF